MTRSILTGLFAAASVAGIAFTSTSCQTGGIGDPCIPEDEFNADFAGFKISQENIESRSFQCESRLCLVNHFQGRTSCPAGQPPRTSCGGPDASCSGDGEKCVEAGAFAPDCTSNAECNGFAGDGAVCNGAGFCECNDTSCPEGYLCDGDSKQCKAYVCHKPGNCQDPSADAAANEGKACCIPGTDTPVAAEVCGQCEAKNLRDAANAVYCSCRCGPAEGAETADDNFNYCECPDGFACAEVRPDVGLGDKQLTGKYCVKANDPIIIDGKVSNEAECGKLTGYKGGNCKGF
jgi:hypothetical protein